MFLARNLTTSLFFHLEEETIYLSQVRGERCTSRSFSCFSVATRENFGFHVIIKRMFGIGCNFGIAIPGRDERMTVFMGGAFKKHLMSLNLV